MNVWVYSEGRACPTYSWSVSGTGFYFDSASGPTTATTNADMESLQLWADGTACGAATITVTDLCGGNDEEYVRCSTGQWVEIPFTSCVISGAITEGDGKTRIQGKYKLREDFGLVCSGISGCTHPVSGVCNFIECPCDAASCHETMGCEQCLEHGQPCPDTTWPISCYNGKCYCCIEPGGTCGELGVASIAYCSRDSAPHITARYEWMCKE